MLLVLPSDWIGSGSRRTPCVTRWHRIPTAHWPQSARSATPTSSCCGRSTCSVERPRRSRRRSRTRGCARRRLTCRATRSSWRSEEHTSELQSLAYLVCRLLLEKKKKKNNIDLLTTTNNRCTQR